jgi:geranylgeranyl transferase type-2 subunit beta
MLYTVSAVQILAMVDGFAELESQVADGKTKVASYIANLQQPNGTFAGDEWGETDTRFLCGALIALSLMHKLPHQQPDKPPLVNVNAAIDHSNACQNFDGGCGVMPGAESHSGQIFTCLAALSIAGELDSFLGDEGKNRLGAWLSERQLDDSGGFNGRPMKLVDVCYAWWVGTSLAMVGKQDWIDKKRLTEFILRCQDPENGGVADRPGDMVDVFHTHFAIAGLSLIGHPGVLEVDPA